MRTAQEFSDYVAPERQPHSQVVITLISDVGEVMLRPNKIGHGYKLGAGAEGLGAADVENELTPRLRRRGAMLGEQRETESDMFFPILIRSTSNTEVRRLVRELELVLKRADGVFRVVAMDPLTGETRYREAAYREGLSTPAWSGPSTVKYGITADFMDPWAYSSDGPPIRIGSAPSQGNAGWVAPFVFPLVAGALGEPVFGEVVNNGDKPAPLTVTFAGQVTEPRIRNLATGAEVGVRGSLAWDERITVDAKNETVELWRVGDPHIRVSVPGRLTRATRIAKMTAAPGRTNYEFRSQAATGAFVEISAPSAYAALI